MHYYSYDLPSAVTEEGLVNMVCASVKDYLGGGTDYVARCQQRVAELEEALGIVTDEKHALQRQVEELIEKDDVTKRDIIDALGRVQLTTFINESGLYALILSSKLESARRFKHWVTAEVLPAIRKQRGYMVARADPAMNVEL